MLAYCEYLSIIPINEDVNDLNYRLSIFIYEKNNIEKMKEFLSPNLNEVSYLRVLNFLQSVINEVNNNNKQIGEGILITIKNEYKEFIHTLDNFKIACFSTSPYLNRMWSSAYANSNKGFCIEYQLDIKANPKFLELYLNLFPVIYSQQRNDSLKLYDSFDKITSLDHLWQYYFNGLLRKSLYWIDQKEWRLILYNQIIKNNFNEDNTVNFFPISKVYLGNKMDREERKKIIEICKNKNIPYVGLKRKTDSFDLVDCEFDCYICSTTKR